MTTNLPLLLTPQPAPAKTQTLAAKGDQPLLAAGDTVISDAEQVIGDVLEFATSLLLASQETGNELPLNGKEAPLPPELLPTDTSAESTSAPGAILAPLPLPGELRLVARLPSEPAATLPVQASNVTIESSLAKTSTVESGTVVNRSAEGLAVIDQSLTNKSPRSVAVAPLPEDIARANVPDARAASSILGTPAGNRLEGRFNADSVVDANQPRVKNEGPATFQSQPLKEPLPASAIPSRPVELPSNAGLLETPANVDPIPVRKQVEAWLQRGSSLLSGTSQNIATTAPVGQPLTGGPVFVSTPSLPALSVPAPLMFAEGQVDANWGQQFAERVGWVIHTKLSQAQVRVHPEHLGPVEMSIELDEQAARVQFTAAQAVTREAIEQSLPKLRALLEEQGLSLDQADVSGFEQSGDSREQQSDEPLPDNTLGDTEGGSSVAAEADGARRILRGLIDTYV